MRSEVIHSKMLDHARKDYPNEACGYLISIEGKLRVVPCVNSAANPKDDFKIGARETLRVKQLGKVLAGYHSHPDGKAELSMFDQMFLKASELPMYVVAYPEGRVKFFSPHNVNVPYEGRDYKLGYQDCFTIVRDWGKQEKGVDIPFFTSPDKWWERGENRLYDHLDEFGYQVPSFARCEVVVFQIDASVPNHLAIKVGPDRILHHLINRLSTVDVWSTFWQNHAVSYWRFNKKL